jgi:AcrR family transcriptional regulator
MKARNSVAQRGRPREFDIDQALNRAMEVFWRKGYEGASLPDLTKAMGINRPSMYAAFGNKEALFRRALDRYAQGPAQYVSDALNAPTAREAIERLFFGVIDLATHPRHPRGCLMVQGALSCGETAECIRNELTTRREARVVQFRRRFQRARREGDLPRSADPATLARFVATIVHGIAVQATSGATRAELQRVAKLALRALPI